MNGRSWETQSFLCLTLVTYRILLLLSLLNALNLFILNSSDVVENNVAEDTVSDDHHLHVDKVCCSFVLRVVVRIISFDS